MWIGGERREGADLDLDRPRAARPRRRRGGRRHAGRGRGGARAGRRARRAHVGRRRSRSARAEFLVAAAAWLRERRLELAALEVREAAKPWPEADGDVCEAIDFLEYYARGALDLAQGAPLLQVPGERNELRYDPARRGRRDLALELPARDPARDGRRPALATGNAGC